MKYTPKDRELRNRLLCCLGYRGRSAQAWSFFRFQRQKGLTHTEALVATVERGYNVKPKTVKL